jgi:glutathione-regulated potassium-efflux system ancillary protein KefG
MRVEVDDLIDAHEVAEILGLTNKRAVSVYQRRYPEMPRPIVDRGHKRAKLWLQSEVMEWASRRGHLRVRLLLDDFAARSDLPLEDATELLRADHCVQADLTLGSIGGSVIRTEACAIAVPDSDPLVIRRRQICRALITLVTATTREQIPDESCGSGQARVAL